jgi:V/A-type H+-transporting ATPase subunit D
MPELHGLPPGRTGRLWLRRRLATAERGAALLDRKLRILRAEQERLRELVGRTGPRWAAACAAADTWLVRAAILSGQRGIRLSTGGEPARVTLNWQTVMGVRYPAAAERSPAARSAVTQSGTVALSEAASAYAEAVHAGVAHAAATAALRAVDGEIEATFRRLRAIADRWIPRLEEALGELTQRLEEVERDETARLRWATRRH